MRCVDAVSLRGLTDPGIVLDNFDPHRDPAPEPSDHKMIRWLLLAVVTALVLYGFVSSACRPFVAGGGRYCSPQQTLEWMTGNGGWWKTALVAIALGVFVWLSDRSGEGKK